MMNLLRFLPVQLPALAAVATLLLPLAAQESAVAVPSEEGEMDTGMLDDQLGSSEPIEPILLPDPEPDAPVTEEDLAARELEEATTEVEEVLPEEAGGEFEVDQAGVQAGAIRIQATPDNRLDDRTIAMRLPGPRGLITDRHGEVLANSEMAWKVGIRMPRMSNDYEKTSYVQRLVDQVNEVLETDWTVRREVLLRHYDNRRWLPLLVGEPITAEQKTALEEADIDHISLRAMYLRVYPKKNFACHSLGYVGQLRPLPTGPIQNGDPLFEEWEGRSGLEQIYDRLLQGRPGRLTYLFGADGEVIHEEVEARAVPGNTVVATLDADWQRHAENVLRANSRRSAAVVLDIYSGEVLVLASNPTFDLNQFIPYISTERWQELNDDPDKPLLARAYQELYCPASTFKIVTCAAGLANGAVTANTYFSCPPSLTLGNTTFVNWHKGHEGQLNVVDAIKRSNNVWMYQCVRAAGSDAFTEMGQRFGYGRPTGLPVAEQVGVMPTDEWFDEIHGWRRTLGNNYNESIGQGDVLATPVQVARMMAAVANGGTLPTLRLVNQVQDPQGRVIQSTPSNEGTPMNLSTTVVALLQRGMYEAVNGSGGTGGRAAVSGLEMAAKTGTGQWTQNRNVAWFAGFVPANRPRYAFAFLYEGRPHEGVAGGRTAGSLAREFFTPLVDEINGLAEDSEIPEAAEQAVVDRDNGGSGGASYQDGGGAPASPPPPRRAAPGPPPPPPVEAVPTQPREERRGGLGGFLHRIFN